VHVLELDAGFGAGDDATLVITEIVGAERGPSVSRAMPSSSRGKLLQDRLSSIDRQISLS
jgi:hypothetical protein